MYLESYNKEAKTTINANLDFIIKGKEEVIAFSICDIGVNVRGVLANLNMPSEEKYIRIKKYDDVNYNKNINITNGKFKGGAYWQYKVCKNDKYTHGIAFNRNHIEDTIIDYSGENKYKLIATFLNDKHNIPVTEDIVKLMDYDKLFSELEVWSAKETNIKAYYISKWTRESIVERLKKIELPFDKSELEKWNDINSVNDYVLEFNKEIRNVMDKNIKIRFDAEHDLPDLRMFEYKRKPYKGQVQLIESGVRTLRDTQRVIYTCQMGTGKTTIGIMCNDLYMMQKNKGYYLSLVVAPNSTLKKWRDEIKALIA